MKTLLNPNAPVLQTAPANTAKKRCILDITSHRFTGLWAVLPGLAMLACLVMAGFSQEVAKKSPETKPAAATRLPILTLKVTDAATGAPLSGCRFDTGAMHVPTSDIASWLPLPQFTVSMTPSVAEGEYRGTIPESHQKRALKLCVRHEGHVPVITPRVDPAQGDSTLSVALQKGQPLEITVRDAQDATVAGASVYVPWLLSLHLKEFSITPNSPANDRMEFIGTTGADGRCILPPCAVDASVLVTHENGFAVAAFANVMRSPTMKLGLYAQVEANVKKNGKPAAGVRYEFHGGMDLPTAPTGMKVLQSFPVVSDAQGHISIPRVLPSSIGRFTEPVPPPSQRRSSTYFLSAGTKRVSVGQTTVFEIEVKEFQARTLTGRFVVQGGGAPAVSRNGSLSLYLNRPGQSGTPMIAGMGTADAEGRFEFERVPAGAYTLQISSSVARPARYALPRGQTGIELSVPAPTADTAGKPFDLGDIEVVDTQK